MEILLDMDEVLTDFVGSACAAWDIDRDCLIEFWQPGVWDMREALSYCLGLTSTMTMNEFWQPIHRNEVFWENMGPLPWVDELVRLAARHGSEWYIVSAPSRCPTCYAGKVRWLDRWLGAEAVDRFIPTRHKRLLAGRGRVLIDDNDANVREFTWAGGRGIVFPGHQNSKHLLKSDPLGYVAGQLRSL